MNDEEEKTKLGVRIAHKYFLFLLHIDRILDLPQTATLKNIIYDLKDRSINELVYKNDAKTIKGFIFMGHTRIGRS